MLVSTRIKGDVTIRFRRNDAEMIDHLGHTLAFEPGAQETETVDLVQRRKRDIGPRRLGQNEPLLAPIFRDKRDALRHGLAHIERQLRLIPDKIVTGNDLIGTEKRARHLRSAGTDKTDQPNDFARPYI